TPQRMPGAEVPVRTVIRPVATGRMTPVWLSFSKLPSRTNLKIQGAAYSGALSDNAAPGRSLGSLKDRASTKMPALTGLAGGQNVSVQGSPRPFKAIKAYSRVLGEKIIYFYGRRAMRNVLELLRVFSLIIGQVRLCQPMSG
ncbi:MAG TPA: hypothetical protein VNU95_14200, partial [Candidatus Acidoferrales bacterium]|nr:hypothetical protein [Candidatus Acidoferrales bacterium]